MLFRLFVSLSVAIGLSSCGQNVKKTSIKSYILGVNPAHEAYKPMIRMLIRDYNGNVGSEVLQYSESLDSANSEVIITKGLEARDGKVGWGQWSSSTERKGTVVAVPGVKSSETTKYSLQVEFDEEFLKTNEKVTANGLPNYELRKLFAHEIGHGFQLDHDPDVKQVMYMDISGEKNFDTYWPKIQAFFSQK